MKALVLIFILLNGFFGIISLINLSRKNKI
jgi:hypothetical protein